MTAANIADIFALIEIDLLKNITHSLSTGNWRTQRVRAFQLFAARNREIISRADTKTILRQYLESAYKRAGARTESEIKAAIAMGHKANHAGATFSVNGRKMKELVRQVQNQVDDVKVAALRYANDAYRKIQIKAQLSMATNLYTLDQSIDIAAADFIRSGINCVEYSNGARMNIVSYSEMALRTGNRRAGLQGQGDVRSDWGEYLVYISQYGACSDTCLPWQGRVYVDDVFSDGKPQPGYPMLSTAIENGLFHPNCRHTSSTWYPEISGTPERMSEEQTKRNATLEAKQRYNERTIRKYKRLSEASVDPANKEKYTAKVSQWQRTQRELIKANPVILRREYARENY